MSLGFVFEVMVYVGLGLPLVNLLIGAFSSGGGGDSELDLDTDLDLDVDVGLDLEMDMGLDMGLDMEVPDIPEIPEVDFDLDGDVDLSSGEGAPTGARMRGPIQFNIYCLCLAMVIMGGTGIFTLNKVAPGPMLWLALLGDLAGAVAAYCLLYYFLVRTLKKNDAAALNIHQLTYKHAMVTFRILRDSPGQIQTYDKVGAIISYRAELDKDICQVDRIDENEEVVITEVDQANNVCYVTLAERKILKK